jgi:hypothetical protein
MADLPQRWIDDRYAWSDHLAVIEITDQCEQAATEIAHGGDQAATLVG